MGVMINKKNDGERTIIQIAGALRGRAIDDLERLCTETSGPLCLDLSQLRSSEDEGVQLLKALAGQGVRLLGVTPYVALMLAENNQKQ